MSSHEPPRLALLLLRRMAGDADPLVGDLLEELHHGRSRAWFCRQVLAVVAGELSRTPTPLTLGLDDSQVSPATPKATRIAPWTTVNLSGTGTQHAGGLGLLALCLLLTIVVPGIWWAVIGTAVAGSALGAALAITRRRRLERAGVTTSRILA